MATSEKSGGTATRFPAQLISHIFLMMTTAEIDSKKRKRKHKSKKGEDVAEPIAQIIAVAKAEKPRKKSKKEHTPEPEVEDSKAETRPEDEAESDAADDDAQVKEVLREAADEDADEEADDRQISGANMEALGQSDLLSGTSMPSMENPTKFSELNLSDRTMEAIKAMGFETMTEIQQKTIPPLLR